MCRAEASEKVVASLGSQFGGLFAFSAKWFVMIFYYYY